MSSEEYQKWRDTTMAQLSYAMNLFLSLATAALGFSVSLIMNEKFVLHGTNKFLFSSALIFQLISVFFGIAAIILRTHNFRLPLGLLILKMPMREKAG